MPWVQVALCWHELLPLDNLLFSVKHNKRLVLYTKHQRCVLKKLHEVHMSLWAQGTQQLYGSAATWRN